MFPLLYLEIGEGEPKRALDIPVHIRNDIHLGFKFFPLCLKYKTNVKSNNVGFSGG